MKELGNLFALEGLDGVGKSTAIEGLRKKGYTVLKTPPSEIASIRTIFDSQQLRVRFMYYLTGVMMAGDEAAKLSVHEKVFCDRYLLTTVAAHNVMGLEESFLSSLTPVFEGIPLPEATILLTATEDARMERLLSRPEGANEVDIANLKINSRLLIGYRHWSEKLGHKLIEVDTTTLGPTQVVNLVEEIAHEGKRSIS